MAKVRELQVGVCLARAKVVERLGQAGAAQRVAAVAAQQAVLRLEAQAGLRAEPGGLGAKPGALRAEPGALRVERHRGGGGRRCAAHVRHAASRCCWPHAARRASLGRPCRPLALEEASLLLLRAARGPGSAHCARVGEQVAAGDLQARLRGLV